MTPFKRPEDAQDYIVQLLKDNSDSLGIKHVGYGTENLTPYYPAVDVTIARTTREVGATQQFKVYFNLNLWVYHANLNASHGVRTKEDLELATGVVTLLHQDYTAGGRLIFSWVTDEDPGVIVRGKSVSVVTTRIVWQGEVRLNFRES